MRNSGLLERYRSGVIVAAAVAPLVACALVAPFRDDIANTNAALGLVLLVVAAAATGIRLAGIVAAVSAAAWFNFFLTQPYYRFTIYNRADIETAVLLLLVVMAVTEIALWGRRRQAEASRQEGYLQGVVETAGLVAAGGSSNEELIRHVADQLVGVLGIDSCRFEPGSLQGHPRLERDGTIVREGRNVDVDRYRLPTNDSIELPVQYAGTVHGHFLLTAATRIARPSLEQRLVAVTLADQVGAALATSSKP